MPKDYRRSRQMRRSVGKSRQFLQMVMAFLTGYLVASFFDFASLSHWVNTKVLTQQTAQIPAADKAQTARTELPKPKFEFYTLLANGRTQSASLPSTQPSPAAKPQTVTRAPVDKTIYQPSVLPSVDTGQKEVSTGRESWIIQVGSFKTLPEAERMKAALILKGYNVSIASISQQQGNWYRVLIGPYGSHNEAQQAQVAFSRAEHVMGMIRKA